MTLIRVNPVATSMAWDTNWAESDQWELYNEENESHRVLVGRAADDRDHAWYALLYIDDGEHIDEQYELGVRRKFQSKGAAIRQSDNYCDANPAGHSDDVVEAIQEKKRRA